MAGSLNLVAPCLPVSLQVGSEATIDVEDLERQVRP